MGITSTSIEVLSEQIEGFRISRLAVENIDGHTDHDVDDTWDSRGQVLVLSEPCIAISLHITVQLLHHGGSCTIPLLWVVNISLSEPLNDDKEVHVTEERQHDNETSDDLTEQGSVIREVDSILAFVEDTEAHVEHSKNDRHLHFDIVSNSELILG